MQSKGIKTFLIIVVFVLIAGVGIYAAKSKTSKNTNNTSQNSSVSSNDQGTVAGATTQQDQTPSTSQAKDTDIILFYGATCPHCQKVEKFLSDNKITDKLKFQQLEVFSNQDNAKLMQEKQNQCKGLTEEDKGGVPFLYSSDKCVVGDQPIIDYFKQLVGMP